MKASVGFLFFMLFLAGLAFVNLKGMKNQSDTAVTKISDISDTAWRPTHIGDMRLQEASKMVIQFNSDGSVAGHTGCNRFFGSYQIAEGTINIGPLGATRMACPEPGNSFEISFLEALQSAYTLSRAKSHLTMRNRKSLVVARFDAVVIDNTQD